MQVAPWRKLQRLAGIGVFVAALSASGVVGQAQAASPSTQTTQSSTTQKMCPCAPVKKKRRVRRKKRAAAPAVVPVAPISAEPVITQNPVVTQSPAVTESPAVAPRVEIPPYPTTAPVQTPPQQALPVPAAVVPAPVVYQQAPPPSVYQPSRWLTKDGVPRVNIEFGGGVALPISQAHNSQNTAGVVEGAVVYNFSRFFTLQGRGEYDRADVPNSVLVAQNQQKGRLEMVSGTVNMLIRYAVVGRFGGYISGGGGYYRRMTKFFATNTGTSDTVTAEYSMDMIGAAIGTGIEWRVWQRTGMKIFGEARYNYVEGQDQSGSTKYQLNSRTTEYAPFLIGVRW